MQVKKWRLRQFAVSVTLLSLRIPLWNSTMNRFFGSHLDGDKIIIHNSTVFEVSSFGGYTLGTVA